MKPTLLYFENQEVKTVTIESKKWFNAGDVCKILGLRNSRQVLISHTQEQDVQKFETLTRGGRQQINYINESGLYALILSSKKENAKQFKHWVTSEVLTEIREKGEYRVQSKKIQIEEKYMQQTKSAKEIKIIMSSIIMLYKELKKSKLIPEIDLINETLSMISKETGINTRGLSVLYDDKIINSDISTVSKMEIVDKNVKVEYSDVSNTSDLSVINDGEIDDYIKSHTSNEIAKLAGLSSVNELHEKLNQKEIIKKTLDGWKITNKGVEFGSQYDKHANGIKITNFIWNKKILKELK